MASVPPPPPFSPHLDPDNAVDPFAGGSPEWVAPTYTVPVAKPGMSTGAKVAIGVGIGFFVLVAVVIVSGIFFFRSVSDGEFGSILNVEEADALGPLDLPIGSCISNDGIAEQVPCDARHTHEVIGFERWASNEYPSYEDAYWGTFCEEVFESYVGIDYFESVLFYDIARPTAQAWEQGDRDIRCLAYEPGETLTRSVRNAQY